ncbi:MAG: TonB-dependent receptor [candidate division KSB1 bacterium]|nr:TonB-dependent receptor [candidate division KSB1 bacterium]
MILGKLGTAFQSITVAVPLFLIGIVPSSFAGELIGRVIERETGRPVEFTNILLVEANRSATAGLDGTFRLPDLPAGRYTLRTFRIGYTEVTQPVEIGNDTMRITLELQRAVIHLGGVTVEAKRGDTESPVEPDILFSDRKLHQALGKTIAQTIDYEPGISQRTMGPAPARPVLRGLSSDRLLILEDRQQAGDLSATSSDHAVAIEPLTDQHIEIIRGPEALIYGTQTLGGVINVARRAVPTQRAPLSGALVIQGESAASAAAVGAEFAGSIRPAAWHVDFSRREAQDLHTPVGKLINTDLTTQTYSAGLSLVEKWGSVGAAGIGYLSQYGIPPDPKGGHPSGVRIRLERSAQEMHAAFRQPVAFLASHELTVRRTLYRHFEFEKNGKLGVEFGQIAYEANWEGRVKPMGRANKGIVGMQLSTRDLASAGLSFTPNTVEERFGGFYYQEIEYGRLLLHGAARFDALSVTPQQERLSPYVGMIRKRQFQGVSAGFSPHYRLAPYGTIGVHLMRTWRAPMPQELFSEGPHLAAYSYEIGNADLKKEIAFGAELFGELKREDAFLRLAFYHNDIRGYVFPQNTGEKSWQRADLYVYRFVGVHALLSGVELSFHLPILQRFHVAGTFSTVKGSLAGTGAPLPYIPPAEGKINIGLATDGWDFSIALRAAAPQRRLGPFEAPTAGYAVWDLSAYRTATVGKTLCVFSLSLTNLFDTVYRRHLNRVREIMPEQGRSANLLLKVFI